MMQQAQEGTAAVDGAMARLAAEAGGELSPETLAVLQEVDHRVKNNLQLIASLILLQSRRAPDPAARDALKSVLERVAAVTTVHRRLFQGDVHRFEVADFLRDLVGDLAATAGRDGIEIALTLEPMQIPASSAAPFALIVNELLTNALKHAFPQGRRGRVSLQLAREADTCVLTLLDDGVGLSDAPPGFGLSLVRLLCQQLHADLKFEGPVPGTRVTLRTPLSRIGA